MKKTGQLLLTVVIFYFWINAMADNPGGLEEFRSQMNSLVSRGADAARRLAS
jgi:hypothetical protein